jgi:hypothetical protein
MLTQMSDVDWEIVVEAFQAVRSRRGDKGRDDRKFLEALHFFTVHNITCRALPAEFWQLEQRLEAFWRLSQRGVFEAMLVGVRRFARVRAPERLARVIPDGWQERASSTEAVEKRVIRRG